MARLNWGCGPMVIEGWENSDVVGWAAEQQHVGDIRAGLPYADDFFDYVVSHHALQMIEWEMLRPVLSELRRVIRPGGWLRVSVPDAWAAWEAYTQRNAAWFPIEDRHEHTVDGKLCMYLTQAGATRSIFTEWWLEELLRGVGFAQVCRMKCDSTFAPFEEIVDLDTRPDESIFMEGRA